MSKNNDQLHLSLSQWLKRFEFRGDCNGCAIQPMGCLQQRAELASNLFKGCRPKEEV